MLRYNWAVIQLARNVVPSASESNLVHLTAEKHQCLVLQFQQVQNQMVNDSMARYHLGQLAFWSGDYRETIDQLAPHPGERLFPLSALLLGYALWNTDQIDEAVATWGPFPDIQRYFLNRAAQAEDERDYELAEDNYQLAMTLAPDWAPAVAGYWFVHSMNLLQEKDRDPTDVDRAVEQAIRQNPAAFHRQLRLGAALFHQRKLELAKTPLMLAIKLEPRSHWPRYYLGLVYYVEQEYRLAEERFMESLEISPNFARGHHRLARTLVQLGRSREALIHYREATRLLPEDPKLARELKALEERLQE